MTSPEDEVCWRAARPCAEPEARHEADVSCRAWYRCESEGDYVIKWRCQTLERDAAAGSGAVVSENDSAFSLCSDQYESSNSDFTDCPPPVVCADETNQQAPLIVTEPGDLSTDLILVIAVTSFAVLAILLTIGSSYKYWSLRKRLRPSIKPSHYVLRGFPYPIRYHSLWGTGFSLSDFAPDTVKRHPSSLSADLPVLFPEVNGSRVNLLNVDRSRPRSNHPDASRSFLPDVYFSKHSSETILRPAYRHAHRNAFPATLNHQQKGGDSGYGRNSHKTSKLSQTSVHRNDATRDMTLQKSDNEEAERRDTSVATGSFVYHDPWGGNSPLWRVADSFGAGKVELSKGTEKDRGEKETHKTSGYSAVTKTKSRTQVGSSGTHKVRGSVGQMIHLHKPHPSPCSGDSHSDRSGEQLHIYRGNLNTTEMAASQHLKSQSSKYVDIKNLRLKDGRHPNVDLRNDALSSATKVSSICIPSFSTGLQDIYNQRHGGQCSDAAAHPTSCKQGQVSSFASSSNADAHIPSSNVYAQPFAPIRPAHNSQGGYNIDKPCSGNIHWPHTTFTPIGTESKSSAKAAGVNSARKSHRESKNTNSSIADKDNRYLRVGRTVYKIVPSNGNNNNDNSSSNSNSSIGSGTSSSGPPGLGQAYRISGLDLSYDNFRNDHLRLLGRWSGGAASSSTLDAGLSPVNGFSALGREESGGSSSSTCRETSRFFH